MYPSLLPPVIGVYRYTSPFSFDAKIQASCDIASCISGRYVHVWDRKEKVLLKGLSLNDFLPHTIAIENKQIVISGEGDKILCLNTSSMAESTFAVPKGDVLDLDWREDSFSVIQSSGFCGLYSRKEKVWEKHPIDCFHASCALHFSQGKAVAAKYATYPLARITLFDAQLQTRHTLQPLSQVCLMGAVNDRLWAQLDDGQKIQGWDLLTGKELTTFFGYHLSCMKVTPELLFTGSMDGKIGVWDLNSLRCQRVLRSFPKDKFSENPQVQDLQIAGHYLGAKNAAGGLTIWDTRFLKQSLYDITRVSSYFLLPSSVICDYNWQQMVEYAL